MEQPIRLDKDSKVPIQQQLYSYIKERIRRLFIKRMRPFRQRKRCRRCSKSAGSQSAEPYQIWSMTAI